MTTRATCPHHVILTEPRILCMPGSSFIPWDESRGFKTPGHRTMLLAYAFPILLCFRAFVVPVVVLRECFSRSFLRFDLGNCYLYPGHRTMLLAYAFPILLCFRAFVVPFVVLRECFSRSFLRFDLGILEFVILNLIIIHCRLSIVNWFLSFVFSPIFDNILRIILKGHGSYHG